MQNATESHAGNYSAVGTAGAAFPEPSVYPYYSATQSGMCNVYIPNGGTLSRCSQSVLMSAIAQSDI